MSTPDSTAHGVHVWFYKLPVAQTTEAAHTPLLRTEVDRVDDKGVVLRCKMSTAKALKQLISAEPSGNRGLHIIVRANAVTPGSMLLWTRVKGAQRIPNSDQVLVSLRFARVQDAESRFLRSLLEHLRTSTQEPSPSAAAPRTGGADGLDMSDDTQTLLHARLQSSGLEWSGGNPLDD
ncbi:MAG: hypothetical protein KDK91_07395 [Gammaproteobacteria bacterium]|nr:hypothetical protein [Gammaproteobacteria bacterium]